MFTWLTELLRKRRQQQTFDQFKAKWAFFIEGDYFSIYPAGVVSEFGPLLRAHSAGKHQGFHSFEAIAADFVVLQQAIQADLAKDVPLERVARSTAHANLRNLG